jgi:hypothetical protein
VQYKISRKKLRESKYEEIDDAVLKWSTMQETQRLVKAVN